MGETPAVSQRPLYHERCGQVAFWVQDAAKLVLHLDGSPVVVGEAMVCGACQQYVANPPDLTFEEPA